MTTINVITEGSKIVNQVRYALYAERIPIFDGKKIDPHVFGEDIDADTAAGVCIDMEDLYDIKVEIEDFIKIKFFNKSNQDFVNDPDTYKVIQIHNDSHCEIIDEMSIYDVLIDMTSGIYNSMLVYEREGFRNLAPVPKYIITR